MGALLQLMALPAACMFVAWLRTGGGNAFATALRRVVALIATRDAAPAASRPTGRAHRAPAMTAAARPAWPKSARAVRPASLARAIVAVGSLHRLRRVRSRFPVAHAGSF